MTKYTGLNVLAIVFLIQGYAVAQTDDLPPISLEFVNFQETRLIKSGKPVTVGVFRVKNNTDKTFRYSDHCGAADFRIQRFVDNEWKSVPWNWCAMGKRSRDLSAGESEYFCVDPEYYRTKYGERLRFGFFIPDGDSKTPSFTWTKMLELPDVNNPDELPYCRYVTPTTKSKNNSSGDTSIRN